MAPDEDAATDDSQQRLNSSTSTDVTRCSVPDMLGGHGPWQFRHWVAFFAASACASLYFFSEVPLALSPPCACGNISKAEPINQAGANENCSIPQCQSSPIQLHSTDSCVKYLEAKFITDPDSDGCSNINIIIYSKCVYALGILLSGITIRLLMLKFGRRSVSLASSLILFISAFAIAWAQNPATFLILRFIISVGIVNIYLLSAYSLMEVIGEEHRLVYGLFGHMGWCLAHFILPLIVWLARDWIKFSLTLSSMPLFMVIALCFIPESVESFLSRGLWTRAQKIIRQAAWSNGCSTQDIEQFTHNFTPQKIQEEMKTPVPSNKESFRAYFQLIFLFFVSFSTSFLYFTLMWLTEWVKTARGTYLALAGTAEIAAILILLFMTCFFSLKQLWAVSTVGASGSLLIMYAKPGKSSKIFSTFPYLLTLFFASSAWAILVYRTLFRPMDSIQAKRNAITTCIAICMGILAATATDFQKFHNWNPKLYVIYGIPNLTAGASIGFMPDRYLKF